MNGILTTVYYVFDEAEGKPVPGSETPYPLVAECHALSMHEYFGTAYTVLDWSPTPDFPLFSQRDIRWKDHGLGGPPLPGGVQTTIGDYGCVITCLAMGLSKLTGEMIHPNEVDEALKSVDAYAGINQNLLIFAKVQDAFPYIKIRQHLICETDPAPIADIDQALRDNCIVLFKIDFELTTPKVDSHYIIPVAGRGGTFYTCHDPWLLPVDQRPVELPPAYCKQDWDAARAIYGGVIYEEAVDQQLSMRRHK